MITQKLFNRLFPITGLSTRKYNLVRERVKLIDALNRILPKYEINTARRVRAFLANCGIETDYFKTTVEYADGWDYDISVNPVKARSLGNYKKGDGPKFKGGGLSQTTGGFNYAELNPVIGKKLGIDFTKNPEKLREDIDIAVESACIFWDSHKLNKYADRREFKQLSAIVNRGDIKKTPLHWEKRKDLYDVLTVVIADDFTIAPATVVEPVEPAPLTDTDVAQSNNAAPVVLTPTTTAAEPAKEDSFLNAALDRNISSDQLKATLPSAGTRIWRYVARPLGLLYAALEAGNVAAWLGVVVAAAIVVYLIYAHREDLKKLWETLKNKFIS